MTKLIATIIAFMATSVSATTLELNPTRTVFVSGPIGENSFDIANQIETLTAQDKEDIYMVINSPGGAVTLGYLIINSMNVAKERGVRFICYVPQMSASMAYQVFANCDERYTLPGAYLLFHPVRISAQITLTPALTKQVYLELRQIEQRMTEELLTVMKVPKKWFYYHYLVETLWTAKQLNKVIPFFFTIVDDVKGLPADYQQFELRQQRSPGFGSKRGYRFIYQAPDTLSLIRQ